MAREKTCQIAGRSAICRKRYVLLAQFNRIRANDGRGSSGDNSDDDDSIDAGSSSRSSAQGLQKWKLALLIPSVSKREAPERRGPVKDIFS